MLGPRALGRTIKFESWEVELYGDLPVVIELRSQGKWAVVMSSRDSVLNRDGTWEYEPLPSNRTAEFLARTRFSLEEALWIIDRADLIECLEGT